MLNVVWGGPEDGLWDRQSQLAQFFTVDEESVIYDYTIGPLPKEGLVLTCMSAQDFGAAAFVAGISDWHCFGWVELAAKFPLTDDEASSIGMGSAEILAARFHRIGMKIASKQGGKKWLQ